jgi:peptidoglycan/xylan/chitin deacetylase (PgdA/CDA1 family)
MKTQKWTEQNPQEPQPYRAWIPLLVYHNIHADPSLNGKSPYSLSVEQFEAQMQYLYEHGYQCLELQHFLRIRYDAFHLSGKAFVLTFDDGYEDFLTNAFPILSRYKFTATVFLATDRVGNRSLWDGATGSPLMTWEQIEDLRKVGITFGSHTCSHPRLLTLSDEQIWCELTASKQSLEARLNEEVRYLAYPYGESNKEIQAMAQQAGYEAACGVITGRNGIYNLWRNSFDSRDSLQSFEFRLTTWYNRLLRLRRWVREDTSLGHYIRARKRGK